MPPHMPSTPRPRSSAADKASLLPCGSPLLWRGKGEPPAPRKTRWQYNPGVGVALWAARPISVLANFLELRYGEVRRIPLPRTPVNRPSAGVLGFACWQHDGNIEVGRYTPSRLRKE